MHVVLVSLLTQNYGAVCVSLLLGLLQLHVAHGTLFNVLMAGGSTGCHLGAIGACRTSLIVNTELRCCVCFFTAGAVTVTCSSRYSVQRIDGGWQYRLSRVTACRSIY